MYVFLSVLTVCITAYLLGRMALTKLSSLRIAPKIVIELPAAPALATSTPLNIPSPMPREIMEYIAQESAEWLREEQRTLANRLATEGRSWEEVGVELERRYGATESIDA